MRTCFASSIVQPVCVFILKTEHVSTSSVYSDGTPCKSRMSSTLHASVHPDASPVSRLHSFRCFLTARTMGFTAPSCRARSSHLHSASNPNHSAVPPSKLLLPSTRFQST